MDDLRERLVGVHQEGVPRAVGRHPDQQPDRLQPDSHEREQAHERAVGTAPQVTGREPQQERREARVAKHRRSIRPSCTAGDARRGRSASPASHTRPNAAARAPVRSTGWRCNAHVPWNANDHPTSTMRIDVRSSAWRAEMTPSSTTRAAAP